MTGAQSQAIVTKSIFGLEGFHPGSQTKSISHDLTSCRGILAPGIGLEFIWFAVTPEHFDGTVLLVALLVIKLLAKCWLHPCGMDAQSFTCHGTKCWST